MYYLFIFIFLFIIERLYFKVGDKYNIIDKPNQRSSHTRITLRGGGIIFYFGALLFFLIDSFMYPWYIAGLTLISVISFVDDIHPISQVARLIFHCIGIMLMFVQLGIFTMLSWWYILIILIFCIGVINIYNFMDGINGITGGYSLIVLIALAYINYAVITFTSQHLIYILVLSVMVFVFFNFRKNAKCFAGDVGSISIAFSILFLIGQLILKTGDFSYIILLVIYGVDSVLTIIHRLMLRENIVKAHRMHLYQIMANELKLPHIIVSLIYMGTQALIMLGYFYIHHIHIVFGYWYLFIFLILLSGVYIVLMKKYFPLHLNSLNIK
jgi:UDP-N-acetylmuramyl pentapeptide phosphotransferase/UDP-N-acetylglucosamine-1-phosphate transferase